MREAQPDCWRVSSSTVSRRGARRSQPIRHLGDRALRSPWDPRQSHGATLGAKQGGLLVVALGASLPLARRSVHRPSKGYRMRRLGVLLALSLVAVLLVLPGQPAVAL